jgi:hypothetical protein
LLSVVRFLYCTLKKKKKSEILIQNLDKTHYRKLAYKKKRVQEHSRAYIHIINLYLSHIEQLIRIVTDHHTLQSTFTIVHSIS